MKLSELYAALKEACPRVAYRAFDSAVETPFICYTFTGSDDVMADDVNYVPFSGFDIELYTVSKDLAMEASVEEALRSLDMAWGKSEVYIESERLYEVVYSIQFIPAAE